MVVVLIFALAFAWVASKRFWDTFWGGFVIGVFLFGFVVGVIRQAIF